METFTLIFLGFLLAGLALHGWLLRRQYRHVLSHRGEVPVRFRGRVSPADHQRAADYTLVKARFGAIEVIFNFLLVLVWTLGGGLDALAALWTRFGLDPVLTGVGLVLSFFLIMGCIDLPFAAWRTFVIEKRFGFNRSTPRRFASDLLLQAALGLAIGAPLTWILLTLMEQMGALWWLWAWTVWIAFTLVLSWAFPVFIAPLFNKFTPLEPGELRLRIEGLLGKCGFSSRGIYVMDGSRRSSHGNAYFSGFGRSKRIVFFDTLMAALDVDELEAVLAHELGHFKKRHIAKRLASAALVSLAGLALLGWLMQQPWFFAGLGIQEQSNATALLLFLLVIPVFSVFFQPLGSYISRRHEFEADDYASEQASGESLIRALVNMYRDNASTLTPDPVYSLFHDSHPPAPVRIAHISDRIGASSKTEKRS